MTKFSLYIYIVTLLIPFQAITMEVNWKYEKVVDKQLRKQYYSECKANKGKKCHIYSFHQSIKLRIVDVN